MAKLAECGDDGHLTVRAVCEEEIGVSQEIVVESGETG